jgi:serine/threonine protein kinase/tetratricopeptide (TPR) repeat protein
VIALGPFALAEPIAQGGMGEVWRGVHVQSGVPVAVKVLTTAASREARFRQLFRAEAQAMAGLSHPGIVQIHEFGDLPASTSAASGGRLIEGSPYLVMEYASRGSMDRLPPPQTWRRARLMLQSLLEALAHAHAHGIIHRDLKPANVLIAADGRPKLADFGIAHAIARGAGVSAAEARAAQTMPLAGTPELMAPEQCRGHHRDFGPWTDLYALGCMAWLILTGRLPFTGPTPLATIMAQMGAPLPVFEPRMGVPAGTEPWLHCLLARPTHLRFRRAADAAYALSLLDEVEAMPVDSDLLLMTGATSGLGGGWGSTEISVEEPADETIFGAGFQVGEPTAEGLAEPLFPRPPLPGGATQTGEWAALSLPGEGGAGEHIGVELAGAGLGLFDLRPVPLTGRTHIREALWARLAEVDAGGHARAVLLRGPAGVGKSRLAEWLTARAHETGAAVTLRLQNGATSPPTEPLAELLRDHLRVDGLSRFDAAARLEPLLRRFGVTSRAEATELLDVVAPEDVTMSPGRRFGDAAERHAIVAAHLVRLTRERPVLVHVDDAQWGLDALDFVRFCLSRPHVAEARLLFVITVRDEDLAARPEEAALLGELAALPACTVLDVPPMGPDEHAALVRRLLVLDAGLSRTLVERTSGNPLHAVQLVRAWVQRNWLVWGPRGFQLSPDARMSLPDDLHTLWVGHVERLLAALPPAAGAALETAALLGQTVAVDEWRAACAVAGLEPPESLPWRLAEARLARLVDEDRKFEFAHSMLRESLERRAVEGGRGAALHAACARALATRGGPGHMGRVGHHLLRAGETDLGVEWLLQGVEAGLRQGDFLVAGSELHRVRQVLGGRSDPEGEALRARALVLSSIHRVERGGLDDAERMAQEALEIAERRGLKSIAAQARIRLVRVAFERADGEQMQRGLALADQELQNAHETRVMAELHALRGALLAAIGVRAEADLAYRRAEAAYAELGDALEMARCRMGRAMSTKQTGDFETAAQLAREATSIYETQGSRVALADALHNVGELERLRGNLVAAETAYRSSLALYEALGSSDTAYAEMNLGITLVEMGRLDAADALLRRAMHSSERIGRRLLVACCRMFMLSGHAARRDWAAFESDLELSASQLTSMGLVEIDMARGWERAASVAAELRPDLAARAAALAEAQWRALGGAGG